MKIKYSISDAWILKKKEEEELLRKFQDIQKKSQEAWIKINQDIEAKLIWGK